MCEEKLRAWCRHVHLHAYADAPCLRTCPGTRPYAWPRKSLHTCPCACPYGWLKKMPVDSTVVYACVWPHACTHVYTYVYTHRSACPSACLHTCLHLCLYTCLRTCPFTCLYTCPCTCLHTCPDTCPYACLKRCQSILVGRASGQAVVVHDEKSRRDVFEFAWLSGTATLSIYTRCKSYT